MIVSGDSFELALGHLLVPIEAPPKLLDLLLVDVEPDRAREFPRERQRDRADPRIRDQSLRFALAWRCAPTSLLHSDGNDCQRVDAGRDRRRGAGDDASQAGYTRIAGHLVRDGARRVGFLAVPRRRRKGNAEEQVGPIIENLASALTSFIPGDVAMIPTWTLWPEPGPEESADSGRMNVREVKPRVIEALPHTRKDTAAAALALERALKMLSQDFAHILVDFSGYVSAGTAPAAIGLVEAVVVVVETRVSRRAALAALADRIPASKHLGAIVIG